MPLVFLSLEGLQGENSDSKCLTMGSAKGKGKADGMGGLCDRSMMSMMSSRNNRWIALSKLRGTTWGAQIVLVKIFHDGELFFILCNDKLTLVV